ncbi:hypothetical protein [Acidisoma cladoniae]|jgi:hypothetical protein|uniref:hypothetical protein n=1 Tax=Acidisoma cladoniae TaxID=3040935 RepID=UPI0025516F25|nr:hypothetical protein [Acidisoma sp. PAMC 29798]
MHPTALGLVLIPLSLLWAANPVRLLQLAFVAAIFEAGAALVLGGSFGLPPAMVPGLLFVTYVTAQYALGMRYPGEGQVLSTMLPLFALLAYALVSVMILPQTFQGTIMVWPQRPDLLNPGYVPLAFNSGNITQSMYLAMNVGVATCAALLVTRHAIPYRKLMKAYLLGGYIAVGIAFWQFASRIAGLPFPSDVIYSNPGWAIVAQALGSVPRVQGTFSEPAGLAFYLSGLCFCCLWLTAHGHRIMRVNILLGLSIFAMLLSTSTTGLLTLAVGLPVILIFTAARGDRTALARLLKTAGVMAVVGSLVLVPAFIMKPSLMDSVQTVITSTMSKGDSQSYTDRSSLDASAVATIGQTDGLGVGWGSFRASSLLPGLLANAGVFGVLMVVLLGWRLARLVRRAGAVSRGHQGQIVVDGFTAALCGQLAAALLSAPTIGSLAFFLQLGCVVGTAARIVTEQRSPGQRPRASARTWHLAPARTPSREMDSVTP